MMLAMNKLADEPALVGELRALTDVRVKIAEPLAPYTSMKIGGPADYLISVENGQALMRLLPLLGRFGAPIYLLGNRSNLLVTDRRVRGAVLRLGAECKRIIWEEEGASARVTVGAAYAVTQLVREAVRKGYAGLEFAEGIPGSVGGALAMNAGAYGSEFEKVVERVEAVNSNGTA